MGDPDLKCGPLVSIVDFKHRSRAGQVKRKAATAQSRFEAILQSEREDQKERGQDWLGGMSLTCDCDRD
jgi:hypothetical protein